MFILNEYKGATINLDFHDGDLYKVFSLLAEAAEEDGFRICIDRRITGRIQINMEEPWNMALLEILTGVSFMTEVVNNVIMISAINH
jgi:hypothetical protein